MYRNFPGGTVVKNPPAIYVEPRKMVQMNRFAGQKLDTDVENKRMDTKGGKRQVVVVVV